MTEDPVFFLSVRNSSLCPVTDRPKNIQALQHKDGKFFFFLYSYSPMGPCRKHRNDLPMSMVLWCPWGNPEKRESHKIIAGTFLFLRVEFQCINKEKEREGNCHFVWLQRRILAPFLLFHPLSSLQCIQPHKQLGFLWAFGTKKQARKKGEKKEAKIRGGSLFIFSTSYKQGGWRYIEKEDSAKNSSSLIAPRFIAVYSFGWGSEDNFL